MKFIFLLLLAFLASCEFTAESNSTQPSDTLPVEQPVAPFASKSISGCYLQVMERDTLIAKLQQYGDRVEGELVFDNYQKDGSRGTVSGKMVGDTIKLQYVFTSEGMNSVMEVYFKVEDDGLIRGIGDIDVKGDTAYFKDPAAITFPRYSFLKKMDCNKLE